MFNEGGEEATGGALMGADRTAIKQGTERQCGDGVMCFIWGDGVGGCQHISAKGGWCVLVKVQGGGHACVCKSSW